MVPGSDLTLPVAPTGLTVDSASPAAASLSWNLHQDTDGDLAGFEVYRDGVLLATVADPSATGYTDTNETVPNWRNVATCGN